MPFSGQRLPAAPRLLYLLSPCLTQQLPYWPKSGRVGPHHLTALSLMSAEAQQLTILCA